MYVKYKDFTVISLFFRVLFLWFCFFLCSILSLVAQTPVPSGAKAEKVIGGFEFTEGPVWLREGYLIFSDIPANTIFSLLPNMSEATIFVKPSGNSNGLSLDLEGRVLMCQHGKRQVARLELDGSETSLVSHYLGKKLNSPNDLAVKSDGSIYFTDPPYGINSSEEELGFYGIFCYTSNGELILLDNSLSRPNGICFSSDEKRLYVNDSQLRTIYMWDIDDEKTISNKKLFYAMSGSGAADGMKTDTDGNLYSTGPGGVWIFSAEGRLLDRISVPVTTSNLAWGENDYKTLYITASTSIYKIRLNATGADVKYKIKEKLVNNFELYQNHPNPFNPFTTLSFFLSKFGHVNIEIFDLKGQLVRSFQGDFSSGINSLIWDARDDLGHKVPSSMYLCRVTVEEKSNYIKIIYLK